MSAITYRTKKDTSFFSDIKIDDLSKLDEKQLDDLACCQTKRLAYELFRFAADQRGFPFNDPELLKRGENENLNMYQMKPFNEMAIKIFRKFGKLTSE